MKWLQQAMLKIRDRRQIKVTLGVQPYSSKVKHKTQVSKTQDNVEDVVDEEDQLLSLQSKQQYLEIMGVDDCVKDKVTRCYLVHIQDVQVISK